MLYLFNAPCILFISQYVSNNKEADNDWFSLESNRDGTRLAFAGITFLYIN